MITVAWGLGSGLMQSITLQLVRMILKLLLLLESDTAGGVSFGQDKVWMTSVNEIR